MIKVCDMAEMQQRGVTVFEGFWGQATIRVVPTTSAHRDQWCVMLSGCEERERAELKVTALTEKPMPPGQKPVLVGQLGGLHLKIKHLPRTGWAMFAEPRRGNDWLDTVKLHKAFA